MSERSAGAPGATRRGFLTRSLVAAAGSTFGAGAAREVLANIDDRAAVESRGPIELFWGRHQGGILTPPQAHTYVAAFDLAATRRDDVASILKAWTAAAARMTAGLPVEPFAQTELAYNYDTSATVTTSSDAKPEPTVVTMTDTGEATGLPASRLTVTFGFGPGLFVKEGVDRFGLGKHRPEALIDLPRFAGDQLAPAQTGGDLLVQACAEDPQVAFHAVRQLARIAGERARVRWAQTGFLPGFGGNERPRNLMGFRDGTNNPAITDRAAMDQFVWVGEEGPDWMRGGSYMVARRIRIALEHWDNSKVAFQEQTVGRHKGSGAPLGSKNESDPLDLDAVDKDGNRAIPENSHVRLAAAASNGGARILRRPYSYNDGVDFTAERWPPWRQGMEYDAGLFFICYQRDPRSGFVKIFENMAKLDMMNQFVTHVGGGLFACPAGAAEGEFVGERLFDRA